MESPDSQRLRNESEPSITPLKSFQTIKILLRLTKQVIQILNSWVCCCKWSRRSTQRAFTMSQQSQLIEFLQQELAVSTEAIALGVRRSASSPNLLPIVLWQYGLVTTHQLDQIYDWLEASIMT